METTPCRSTKKLPRKPLRHKKSNMTLYKYISAKRAETILQDNEIRFTQAVELNDPFEMMLSFDGLTKNPHKKMFKEFRKQFNSEIAPKFPFWARPIVFAWAWWQIHNKKGIGRRKIDFMLWLAEQQVQRGAGEGIQEVRSAIGVLSLSEDCNNLLMWSHYGDAHRGVVIALNEKHPALNAPRAPSDEFNHPRRVEYSEKKPKNYLDNTDGVMWLLTKSRGWNYEKEWRVIKPVKDASRTSKNQDQSISHLFNLPPEAIEGVIIGARTPDTAANEVIRLIQSDERYAHAWLRKAELQHDAFELRIRNMPSNAPKFRLRDDLQTQVAGDYPDEESAWRLGGFCHEMAKYEHAYPLDLRKLNKILVVDDLEALLLENDSGGERPGRTGYFARGFYEKSLFLVNLLFDKKHLPNLLDEKADNRRKELHHIHRGLARAHDLTQRYRMFGTDYMTRPDTGAVGYLMPCVHRTWTEYIISFMTLETADFVELKKRPSELLVEKTELDARVAHSIAQYKEHDDAWRLLEEILPPFAKHIDGLASLIGFLAAAGCGVTDLDPEMPENFYDSGSNRMFSELSDKLASMKLYYPKWNGPEIYEPLINTIKWRFAMHGVRVIDAGENVFVDVL